MPTPLTSAIETSLATGRINTIDLMRINLPWEQFNWSTQEVPEKYTGEGITYEARLKSVGALTFKPGFQDGAISVSFSNHDGLVKSRANQGYIWERGEVSICRLFPDLDPPYNRVGTWDAPHWRGWIKQAPSFEDISQMKVSPGFSELNRPALRRFSRTDMSHIGSEQFPYDPLNGTGLPQIKASGTVTSGSTTTLITSDDISELQESWLIFVKVKKIIGRIVSISTGTGQVEVEYWLYGGDNAGETVPESGDSWIAGPAYTSYDGMESTCKSMGMFGPHSAQNENDLNVDTRRYFKALNNPGNAYLEKAAPVSSLANSLFSSVEGKGNDDDVIPVRFGEGEADLKVLASGQAGKFMHVLGTIGEGRVGYLGEPYLDGVYQTDKPNPDTDANDDSWIEGGTSYEGADDQDGVDAGQLTVSQQKQAIGSLQSRARNHKVTLETVKANPLGFNNQYGDGCSLDGFGWSRGRWEVDGYNLSGEPLVRIKYRGVETKTPEGSWVQRPNLIEAAYYFLVNSRWGAKLLDGRLNISDFSTESEYAGEIISSTGSEPKIHEGTIVAGPDDADAPTLPPCCIVVPSTIPLGQTREDGLICTITTATKTYTMTVRGEAAETGSSILSWIRTPEGTTQSAVINDEGWLLVFYENFDEEIPEAGDTFVLSGAGLTEEGAVRFAAEGSLVADKSYGKMLDDIARNFNGAFIPKNGKISPVIRRAVDLSVVNTRRLYTDEGANRNVIKGTMKFTPLDTSKIPTAVRVEFVDRENGQKQDPPIVIRNAFAEERIREITGSNDDSITEMDLCLTGTPDQAIRVGSVYLGENSFIREVPGYHPGEISMEVPIHDAQDVVIVEDVYPIYSENFPYWCRYMRVTELVDNAVKGTVTIKGTVYLEEMYSDAKTDFIVAPGPVIQPPGPGIELQQLQIASLTEGTNRDDEGVLKVSIAVEITLP